MRVFVLALESEAFYFFFHFFGAKKEKNVDQCIQNCKYFSFLFYFFSSVIIYIFNIHYLIV